MARRAVVALERARSSGVSTSQWPGWKRGQRGWNTHAAGGFDGRRHVAGEDDPLAPADAGPFVSARGTAERSAAVYGWRGCSYMSSRRPSLDDAPDVHDRDPVGDLADHREVVRDEDVREVEVRLQALEQVEDLRLHRDVERGDGLVADDQLRLERERARDADPLALAAGELVRVAVDVLGREADAVRAARGTRFFTSFAVLWIANGSPTIWPTLLRGFSDEYGSWKIDLHLLAHRAQLPLRQLA